MCVVTMAATVLQVSRKTLTDEQITELIEKTKQWALLEGNFDMFIFIIKTAFSRVSKNVML